MRVCLPWNTSNVSKLKSELNYLKHPQSNKCSSSQMPFTQEHSTQASISAAGPNLNLHDPCHWQRSSSQRLRQCLILIGVSWPHSTEIHKPAAVWIVSEDSLSTCRAECSSSTNAAPEAGYFYGCEHQAVIHSSSCYDHLLLILFLFFPFIPFPSKEIMPILRVFY